MSLSPAAALVRRVASANLRRLPRSAAPSSAPSARSSSSSSSSSSLTSPLTSHLTSSTHSSSLRATFAINRSSVPPVPNPYGPGTRTRMLPGDATSYEALRAGFTMPRPLHYNIGADITDKHAPYGSRTAMVFVDEEGRVSNVTFDQLIAKSNQVANALVHQCGVRKGDRVAILMSQSPEAALLHAAIYKTGGVAVPLFVLFGPEALKYRLQDSGATTVFVEPSKLDELMALAPELPALKNIIVTPPMSAFDLSPSSGYSIPANYGSGASGGAPAPVSLNKLIASASTAFTPLPTLADDPALIIYTSGTTGPPKGALHAHRVLLGHLPGVEFPQSLFPQPGDLFWTPADWAWIGGLLDVLLPSLHHGVPVLACRMKKFDPERAFRLLGEHKVRNAFMPPTALKMMREVSRPRERFSYSMRSIGSGGETLGEAMLEWGRETFGFTVNEFYGQTECNLVLGNCERVMPVRPGSMGRAVPGHDVQIVNEAGEVQPPGTVGNIGVRAPHPVMFLEYLNKPAATKEKFAGGFLLTGDLGRMDEDGYFWYVGRSDDVIKSAGYRIGPSEIEDCILRHPAVSNAAAVGTPCPLRNEAVKLFVVLAASHQTASAEPIAREALSKELGEFVKARLAKHEYPRQIEFVDALPMTTTGKVIRKDLKRAEYEKYYRALGQEPPKI